LKRILGALGIFFGTIVGMLALMTITSNLWELTPWGGAHRRPLGPLPDPRLELTTATRQVIIDAQPQPITTVIIEDTIYLPLAELAPLLGATLEFDSGDNQGRRLLLRRGQERLTLSLGSAIVESTSGFALLDNPVVSVNNTFLVPLQLLQEHLQVGLGVTPRAIYISNRPAGSIPVLVYHAILPDAETRLAGGNTYTSMYVLCSEVFHEQMNYLYNSYFYTATLADLEDFLYRGRLLPEQLVMLHFDDGFYCNIRYAYPILKAYGFRATLFLITEKVAELGDNQPPLDYGKLTWAALPSLVGTEDVFETASHSHSLHRTQEGDSTQTLLMTATQEEVRQDLLRSFEIISNHSAYSFPLSQHTPAAISALRSSGVTMAFVGNYTYVTINSNPFNLERIGIARSADFALFRDIVHRRMR